jgi:UDP-N-acetylmuramate dehydrogenase
MHLFQNKSLKEYNTFNINVKSLYSFFASSEQDILNFIDSALYKEHPSFVLGGGSNVLFTGDFNGIVIHIQYKGIQVVRERNNDVLVKIEAGENWDQLVEFCVNRGYGGIENLSLIPGTVGASPVQNIGAYGVELKDVFYEAEFIETATQKKRTIQKEECSFGYRESIFKKELANRAILLNVTLKLSKTHQLNLDYGSIKDELKAIKKPGIKDVREAVIKIREEKLPDPKQLPNAGSFFKNPVISPDQYERIALNYQNLIYYKTDDGKIKLAAAQLIDLCGWKGTRDEHAGVHDKQALVLVNHNNATGQDLLKLATRIEASVYQKFGIKIDREVTVI